MALDIFQIGRAFMATRAYLARSCKVLDSGLGEEMWLSVWLVQGKQK